MAHNPKLLAVNKKKRANTSQVQCYFPANVANVQDKREKSSTDSIHPMIENVEQINS
jgi:hypothetical protein